MTESSQILHHFQELLSSIAPQITNRLQPGLSHAQIESKTAMFAWKLPQDASDLYQWHDGLFSTSGNLNPIEKLIRLKDKWHGELSGRENEIHLQCDRLPIVVKFLPLDYALSGHRHLKLGRCPIDLLPLAIVKDANSTIYCLMRLDPDRPIIYCANGTQLPPIKVTESFLATQPQFDRLSGSIAALSDILLPKRSSSSGNLELIDDLDLTIDSTQFDLQFPKPN